MNTKEKEDWIFIPLDKDFVIKIYFWIKHIHLNQKDDENLASECEKYISKEFYKNGLEYNTDKYGEIKMECLRIFLGSDGLAIPEQLFLKKPSADIVRIKSPLRNIL
jgi:hypothetical protein